MNPNQEAFLREYLRTGNKITAYQAAYPKARQSSIKSAVNRLLRTCPEIRQAVRERDRQLDENVNEEVKAQKRKKYLALYDLRELHYNVVKGHEMNEKVYKTREGFERLLVRPSVSQKLAAANACMRLEGWAYRPPARTKAAKPKEEEKKPAEPEIVDVYIGGVPIDEYGAHYTRTAYAYYDPEDGTCRLDPNNHIDDRFIDIQKRRGERKDAERDARMTAALELEEKLAMCELESRPADESLYRPQADVIDSMWEQYLERDDKDPQLLEEIKLLQTMAGLRFLHHRHRYEAERAAGWQFHPLNNNLVRKAPSGSPQGGGKATATIPAPPLGRGREGLTTLEHQASSHTPVQASSLEQLPGNKNEDYLKTSPKRQQTATFGEKAGAVPEASVQPPPPEPPVTTLQILKAGYSPLGELLQDEWDYYIRNQGSTTWRQLHKLKRFAAHRGAAPEVRQQIEKETGWFYHPANPNYGKKDPKDPLVRTKFPGPPGTYNRY